MYHFKSEKVQKLFSKPLVRYGALTLCTFILLYSVILSIALPFLFHQKIPILLSEKTGTQVIIGTTLFNPFTTTLHSNNIAILDSSDTLITLKRISLSIRPMKSLLYRELHIGSITLSQPHLTLRASQNVEEDETTTSLKSPVSPGDDTSQIAHSANNQSFSDTTQSKKAFSLADIPAITIDKFAIVAGKFLYSNPSTDLYITLAPLNFSTKKLSTRPHKDAQIELSFLTGLGGTLSLTANLAADLTAVSGLLSLDQLPLWAIGNALQNELPFSIRKGMISGNIHYSLTKNPAGSPKPLSFSFENSTAHIDSLIIGEKGNNDNILVLPLLSVDNASLSVAQQSISADRAEIDLDSIHISLDPDGTTNLVKNFDFSQLLKRFPALTKLGGKFQFYTLHIKETQCTANTISFTDETYKTPARHALTNLIISAKNLGKNPINDTISSPRSPFPIALDAQYNGSGGIAIKGTMLLAPFTVDSRITFDKISAQAWQSYLKPLLAVTINEGTFSGDFALSNSPQFNIPLQLIGTGSLDSIRVVNSHDGTPFIQAQQVSMVNTHLQFSPMSLTLQKLSLTRPHLYGTISKSGTLNVIQMRNNRVQKVYKKKRSKGEDGAYFIVDTVEVTNLFADIKDSSLLFGFTSQFHDMSGVVTGFSTHASSNISYSFLGKYEDLSTIRIDGFAQPFSTTPTFKFTFYAKGIQVPHFTPYTATFTGLTILDGTLETTLKYYIVGDSIWGENHVRFNNVVFGDKVVVEKSTKIPFKLALEILADRDGIATVDVDISGKMSDPDFHLQSLIGEGMGRALGKVASAPFRAMGRSSDAKKLREINFVSGTNHLQAIGKEKLKEVAAILREHPKFVLTLLGVYDPKSDEEMLKEYTIVHQLATNKRDSTITPSTISLYPQRVALFEYYEEITHTKWKEVFKKFKESHRENRKERSANAIIRNERLHVAFAQQALGELVDSLDLSQEAITDFTHTRALVVQKYLVEKLAIPKAQLEVISRAKELAPTTSSQVYLSLKYGHIEQLKPDKKNKKSAR